MNTKTNEALVILQEECAEVIQEVSKCFRFGIDNLNKDGVLHSTTLNMEVGDMLALVDILINQGVLDRDVLEFAKESKIEKQLLTSEDFQKMVV